MAIRVTTLILALVATIEAAPPLPTGNRLREIVAKHYPAGNVFIGGTTGWRKLKRGSGVVLNREFSYVTPENDFKQNKIHPSSGKWHWDTADAWVNRCAENKQVLRLHGPISPQCSRWVKDDKRTPAELETMLREFMTALCKRYDRYQHVRWMDVVNETITTKGEWMGPKPGVTQWENPWTRIGFDRDHPLKPPKYIRMAFEIATQHAPNTKLIINQHGSMEPAMWNKVKALVVYLRQQGLRVDGIGWQAHVNMGWEKQPGNVKRLGELIDWAHANKLSFHVTENNVWMKRQKNDSAQAETFAAILQTLLEKRHSGVVTWNVWNLSDGDAWMKSKDWRGCIFYDDFRPKPAYYALQKVLIESAKQ
ncbi:MAG: endo-1,4-beta-xylanase [Verrucomicrobiae bacterium]|nr:endo-1,4-beta-xylanase [Verrucomicrobiae bacterium]NNJ86073.1 hypothetical protein [Akkermansiaceae bacterium]